MYCMLICLNILKKEERGRGLDIIVAYSTPFHAAIPVYHLTSVIYLYFILPPVSVMDIQCNAIAIEWDTTVLPF